MILIRQLCTTVLAVIAAFRYFGQRTNGVWRASARAYRRRRTTERKRMRENERGRGSERRRERAFDQLLYGRTVAAAEQLVGRTGKSIMCRARGGGEAVGAGERDVCRAQVHPAAVVTLAQGSLPTRSGSVVSPRRRSFHGKGIFSP